MMNITDDRNSRMQDISDTLRTIRDFVSIYEKQIDKCKERMNEVKMTDEEFGLQMKYHHLRFDASIKYLIDDIDESFNK